MKKIIVVFMCVFMVLGGLPIRASAIKTDSGKFGENVNWKLTGDGVLTVSGEGDMYEYFDGDWMDYEVNTVVIEDGVTSIGGGAFIYCEMESIVIPESVTSIGDNAFYICPNLESVEIPASVTYIGAEPFWGCSGLKAIWVNENNQYYCSDESGVLYNKEMTELIQVPRGLSGDYCIADGVTWISGYRFDGVTEMSSLTIPKSVEFIEELAFDRCMGLSTVTVHEDNPYYSSDENGILYDKDKTTLVYVPCNISGELKVHENVTEIMHWAFNDAFNTLEVIRFAGDAPATDVEGLLYWAKTVYYPSDNPTWTEEVMNSFEYEEEIEWIAYETEKPADSQIDTEEIIIDNTEEPEDTVLEEDIPENSGGKIALSILRGLGIGAAGVALIAGVIFAVMYVQKRKKK